LDDDFAFPLADRAYLRLVDNDPAGAVDLYERSAEIDRDLLERAKRYRSLPDAVAPIRAGLAGALTPGGVALERLGRLDDARRAYRASIDAKPSSLANYNLGVTYWNRDWPAAVEAFSRAVELDPSSSDARRYLEKARAALQKT